MTTVQTYAKEIRCYRATAGGATKQAKKHAQFAADSYARAAQYRAAAAQLMAFGRPENLTSAAEYERMARLSEHLGDRFIQHSAFQDQQAVFYRGLAARYVAMSRSVEIEES
jgi:hypothetical protein